MNLTVVLLTALVLPAAVPARAQAVVGTADREALRGIPDRWGLSVGDFWQSFETNVRLDGETGRGTDIDLEKDLGLERQKISLELGGYYRFSDRHRLDLAYASWGREHTSTIDRQIEWGDLIFDAGATITAHAKSKMFNAIYRYSFINNGRVIFGLDAGISSLWHDFTLSGEGTISGGSNVSTTIGERKKVIFPIPVIGLHLETTLIKKLFWRLEDNFFAASIAGYDYNVNEFTTSIIYFPAKHLGLGGGFSSTASTLETSGSHGGDVRVRAEFSGVTVYLQFPF